MAPRVAVNWRRPYTSIYNDNYRYGNSLYSDTLSDIEKRYTDSLSRTQLRSDRGDLAMSTFAGSTLTSSPNPGATNTASSPVSPRPSPYMTTAPSPKNETFSTFQSRLNTALHSPYITEDFEPLLSSTERRARSLETMRPRMQEDHPFFSVLPKVSEKPDLEKVAEEPKTRRKIPEPAPTSTSTGGGSSSQWREKCRDLQLQLDDLTQIMGDTGSKVREQMSNIKGKFHTELNDLVETVEQTSRHCNELQKTVKSQANQILGYQTAYDDIQRHLQESQDEIGTWQRRCQNLRKEMDRVKVEMEEAVHRSSSSSRI